MEEACLRIANQLVADCQIDHPRIVQLTALNAHLYHQLFEVIFKVKIAVELCLQFCSEETRFRLLIRLAEYVLDVNLDHICPQALLRWEKRSHFHLLEILSTFRQQFPRRVKSPKEEAAKPAAIPAIFTVPKRIPSSPSSTTLDKSYQDICHSLSSFSICSCPELSDDNISVKETKPHSTPIVDVQQLKSLLRQDAKKSVHTTSQLATIQSRQHSKSAGDIQRVASLPGGGAARMFNVCVKNPSTTSVKRIPVQKVSKTAAAVMQTSKSSPVVKPTRESVVNTTNAAVANGEEKNNNNKHEDIKSKASNNLRSSSRNSAERQRTRQLLQQLEELSETNFSLEIGKRIHETLKLRDKTKQIVMSMENLKRQEKRRKPAGVGRAAKPRKRILPVSRYPRRRQAPKRKPASAVVPKPIHVEEMLSKFADVPSELVSIMNKQEFQQQIFVRNTLNEIQRRSNKTEKMVEEAVVKQLKRSEEIKKDIDHVSTLDRYKSERMKTIAEQSVKRELRTERAKLYTTVKEIHREILSKYKSALSQEEAVVRNTFQVELKQRKEDLLDLSKRIREDEDKELRRQRLVLTSLDNLYKNNIEMLREGLDKEESQLKKRLLHQTTSLKRLQRQFKEKLDEDVKRVTNKLRK